MGIVRRDKTLAGYNGNIESVLVVNATADYSNGVMVTLGGLADANKYGREVKEARLTTAGENGETLMVISPELMYDESLGLEDFVNKEDKIARAYRLFDGDIVSLTVDLLPEGVKVGDHLVAGAEGALEVATVGAYKVAFEVIEDAGYELSFETKAFALAVKRDFDATDITG